MDGTVLVSVLHEMLSAKDEDAVVRALIGCSRDFGFEDSRYYDAIHCPFGKTWTFFLRNATRRYSDAGVGYRIVNPTFDNSTAELDKIYVETADKYSAREQQGEWPRHLDLLGQWWIDVPVFEDDDLIGLWACNRAGDVLLTAMMEREILSIAKLAGMRLAALQRRRTAREISSMLQSDSSLTPEHAVRAALESIARALDAQRVAYFRYDASDERLKKQVEVRFDDAVNGYDVVSEIDESYGLSEGVVGMSLQDAVFQFIPDVRGLLMLAQPVMPIVKALQADTILMQHSSMLSVPVEFFGAPGGLIRVLDRRGGSHLLFTSAQKDALHQLTMPFRQILSSVDLRQRLNGLWSMLAESLRQVQHSKFQFQSIGQYLRSQGVLGGLVVVIGENDSVVEAWGIGQSDGVRGLESLIGTRISAPLEPEACRASQLPDVVGKILGSPTGDACVVPFREPRTKRIGAEATVSYFVLSREGLTSNFGHKRVSAQGWRVHALNVVGQLIGTMRELSRNRRLLYLAEEAIGTIGHEIRSPASSIHGLGTEACDVGIQALSMALTDEPIAIPLLPFGEPGGNYKTSRDAKEVIEWLSESKRRIEEHGQRITRVVQDAIKWARMGGATLEAHFTNVSIPKLIAECRDELRNELREKPYLKVDLSDTPRTLEPIVGDPYLLKILFTNLLDNAIKYSHRREPPRNREGQTYESAVKVRAERQQNIVDIFITNWGLGIDQTDYENIFSSFYRSSVRDRLHTIRGVGLGLPTCRKIALVHGGSIRVKSVFKLADPEKLRNMEGFETTFIVRLPTTLRVGRVDIDMTKINQKR